MNETRKVAAPPEGSRLRYRRAFRERGVVRERIAVALRSRDDGNVAQTKRSLTKEKNTADY